VIDIADYLGQDTEELPLEQPAAKPPKRSTVYVIYWYDSRELDSEGEFIYRVIRIYSDKKFVDKFLEKYVDTEYCIGYTWTENTIDEEI
jgi:hypothetical protein